MNALRRFFARFRRKPSELADVQALLDALPDDQATRNALGRWIAATAGPGKEPLTADDLDWLIARYRAGGISIDRWRIEIKEPPS